ncbi:MAG: hypothetical protein JWL69_2667 [Phycisphaerales bacterium]|nr:hypothetical protein [Phycisphaerales bacterium]
MQQLPPYGRGDAIRPAGLFEAVLAAVTIFCGMAAEVVATRSVVVVTRPPWVDEIFTLLLVREPSARNAFAALASGVESHPPAFHAVLRLYAAMTGRVCTVDFRIITAAFVGLALLGIYLICRRCVSVIPAVAAVLLVWSRPVVIHNAFELRFYGPLLAASVWFAYLLILSRRGVRGARIPLAIIAAFLCTVHYFGVLSLCCIWAGDWVANRRGWREVAADSWPLLAGLLAVAACVPLALSQRHGTSVGSWIARPSAANVVPYLKGFYPGAIIPGMVLFAAVSALIRRIRRVDRSEYPRPAWRDFGGLLGLAAIPFALVAMSFAGQPAMVERYAIAVAAVLAPAAALLVARMNQPLRILACILLVVSGVQGLRGEKGEAAQQIAFEKRIAGLAAELRALPPDGGPIVFQSPHDLFPMAWVAPELGPRLYSLDVDRPDSVGGEQMASAIFCRDLCRLDAHYLRFPQLMPLNDLAASRHFYWVGNAGLAGFQRNFDQATAGFAARPVSKSVLGMTRSGESVTRPSALHAP